MKQEIGIIGLGVMGRRLALNMERNGFGVSGLDVDKEKTKEYAKLFKNRSLWYACVYTAINSIQE